jgi:MoxR-like ATPase
MLKLRVGYPTRDEEKEIMRRMASGDPIDVQAVATPTQILDARHRITELYMDDRIMDYIVDIVLATREPAAAGLPISRRSSSTGPVLVRRSPSPSHPRRTPSCAGAAMLLRRT